MSEKKGAKAGSVPEKRGSKVGSMADKRGSKAGSSSASEKKDSKGPPPDVVEEDVEDVDDDDDAPDDDEGEDQVEEDCECGPECPCDPGCGMDAEEDEGEEETVPVKAKAFEKKPSLKEEEHPGRKRLLSLHPDDKEEMKEHLALALQEAAQLDEDLQTLFMAKLHEDEHVEEPLTSIDDLVGVTLSTKTKDFLGIHDTDFDQDAHIPHSWLNVKRIRLHIFTYGEGSEFHQFYEQLKYYPDLMMLIGHDIHRQTGHEHFVCLTVAARNRVLNPPRKSRIVIDMKKKEDDYWNEMASLQGRAKKWRGMQSDADIETEKVLPARPLIKITVSRLKKFFGGDCNFEDSDPDNPHSYTAFETQDEALFPGIQKMEMDMAIQVKGPMVEASCQTSLSFKRNKIVQAESQMMPEDEAEAVLASKGLAQFMRSAVPLLERVLLENDIPESACIKTVQSDHTMDLNTESKILQEYQTCVDPKHSKGRTVHWMKYHPALEDVVVMAVGEDVTIDKRIDRHSKVLMEPNYVLFWDLKDSAHPQILLDAPNDVFYCMINPSDPHLVCGGCANGQVLLWDLGRIFYELRARTQERNRKKSTHDVGEQKIDPFMDLLKDNSEKNVCPLIPPVGLSNLDNSHKEAITSVAWLPSHVELGRNGMMYQNSAGGRSIQFFSMAGDGTMRLWDIRPPKPGMDDSAAMDEEGDVKRDVIKVNPWLHLENNQWKWMLKINLMDDNGTYPMYAALMSLTELRSAESQDGSNESLGKSSTSKSSKLKKSKNKSKKGKSKHGQHSFESGEEGDEEDEEEEEGEEEMEEKEEEDDLHNTTSKKLDALIPFTTGQSSVFLGTETGEVAFVDWMKNKDGTPNNDNTVKTCQSIYLRTYHDGAITSISRHPAYDDVLLVVGGGQLTIWKEKCEHPVLQCVGSDLFYWCATWSNSRPSVFYVGTREGCIVVWDLMDKINGPVLTQQLANSRITAISLPAVAVSASKKQFIACTDAEGVLYIHVLPRAYARPLPNEDAVMQEFLQREAQRAEEWVANAHERHQKIIEIHNSMIKRKPKTEHQKDREERELEARLNKEYLEFLAFQANVLETLQVREPQDLVLTGVDESEEVDEILIQAQVQQFMDDRELAAEEEEEDEDEEEDEGESPEVGAATAKPTPRLSTITKA